MNKCQVCEKVNGVTKIENREICQTCYFKVFNEVFKSEFTISEACDTLKFLKDYKFKLAKHLNWIQKDSTLKREYKAIEQEISMKLYNKYRECLTKKEHIKVMNHMQTICVNKEDNKKEMSYNYEYNVYLEGCEYLKI